MFVLCDHLYFIKIFHLFAFTFLIYSLLSFFNFRFNYFAQYIIYPCFPACFSALVTCIPRVSLYQNYPYFRIYCIIYWITHRYLLFRPRIQLHFLFFAIRFIRPGNYCFSNSIWKFVWLIIFFMLIAML
jgi:hypothetical protein